MTSFAPNRIESEMVGVLEMGRREGPRPGVAALLGVGSAAAYLLASWGWPATAANSSLESWLCASAAFAAAAVPPALYWASAAAGREHAGLCAALLAASNPWLVEFARSPDPTAPLFLATTGVTLWCWARVRSARRVWPWTIATATAFALLPFFLWILLDGVRALPWTRESPWITVAPVVVFALAPLGKRVPYWSRDDLALGVTGASAAAGALLLVSGTGANPLCALPVFPALLALAGRHWAAIDRQLSSRGLRLAVAMLGVAIPWVAVAR